MNEDFRYLQMSVVEAVTLLQRDTTLPTGAHHALAVLQAALLHLHHDTDEESTAPMHERAGAGVDDDSDADSIDRSALAAPNLLDYRQERGMRIPAFTTFLGITHQEYAHVIHRHPLDRRLRDQIAYKLGVNWREIAEFMPAQPLPRPEIVPLPTLAGAPIPPEPWYLVDPETGRIVSGPHDTPIPANAGYLGDPLTYVPTNLVVLWSSWISETEQLPPEGYSARDREVIYDDSTAEGAARAAEYRAALEELAEAPYGMRRL